MVTNTSAGADNMEGGKGRGAEDSDEDEEDDGSEEKGKEGGSWEGQQRFPPPKAGGTDRTQSAWCEEREMSFISCRPRPCVPAWVAVGRRGHTTTTATTSPPKEARH